MEMQRGSLVQLVGKLTVKARTTTDAICYGILLAQLVNLQFQMALLSLNLEAEKVKLIISPNEIERAKNQRDESLGYG